MSKLLGVQGLGDGVMRSSMETISGLRPLYLRLSVTEQCNLQCLYCRPAHDSGSAGYRRALSDEDLISVLGVVKDALPIYKLRLTGGDPLVRPGLPGLVKKIRSLLPHVELAATTNGLLLSRSARLLKESGLDSLNISLDTIDEGDFERVSGVRGLSRVLDGIREARASGFGKIKLNTVLLRSVNGDCLPDLAMMAQKSGCELRLIELMPIGVASRHFESEFVSAAEALIKLRAVFGEPVPLGIKGTSTRYLFNSGGKAFYVGVIPTISSPFCDGCDRLRIDSKGWIYPCLHDYQGMDLMDLYRREGPVCLKDRIRRLHEDRKLPILDWTSQTMIRIGG
ncbi:MAG: GTP 3',8-cyclase MoaA [Leptospirales bacterium]